VVNGQGDPWEVPTYHFDDMVRAPEVGQLEDMVRLLENDVAERVRVHEADVVSIPAEHGEDHCGMCPDEEPAGQNIAEGGVVVVAYIAHQAAYAVQLEVDVDDHVCRIRVRLHRMVEFSDQLLMDQSRSSHGQEHPWR